MNTLRARALPPWLPVAAPLTLLVILFLILIPHHEPWFDEAQAWLLARDSSHLDLIWNRLRYEGHPFLWYFVLKFFIGLGFPYAAITWISAGLAVAASAILLIYSPFPLVFRVLWPFTYFLFFQYGIVSRSYSLFPLLFFAICLFYPTRFQRPIRYVLALAALAQVSVHGAIVSLCWMGLLLWECRHSLISELRNWNHSPLAKAVLYYTVGGLFLIATLWPRPDLIRPDFFEKQFFLIFKMVYVLWNGPLTEYWPASLFVFGASLYWFYRRGLLTFYLIPFCALYAFFGIAYGKAWHEGVGFCLWLSTLWLSFLNTPPSDTPERRLISAAMAVLLGFQLYWSAVAFRHDYAHPYSGAKALAGYLKEKKLEKSRILATQFFAPVILPYFEQNIFLNFNKGKRPSFFWWSTQYSFNDNPAYILNEKPDLLILGIKFQEGNKIPQLPGYEYVQFFPGFLFLKDRVLEKESFALFRRQDFVIP